MKFQIKNIGAIGYADIDIEGITIIAGENNVGKSTVGKALYAFLYEMSLWKKIYDDICSTRIEQFLYQNSIYLEDLCMKISGARRRRTSKADQLQKRYSRYEDVLVAIEDYQIAEGEKTKEQTRENMMEIFLRYCHDYISLYAKDNTEELWEKNEDEVYAWCEKALRGIDSLEQDELKIQTQKIKGAFQEVFNSQYRKIGTSESEIALIDDGGRDVKLTVTDEIEELNQPVRAANRNFFIESPKIYDYLSNTSYGHVQKEYLRHLMSPNIFKKGKPNRMKEDHMRNGQLKAAYNVQVAVENYFIIHGYVSNDRTDYNTLIPVLEKHRGAFGEVLEEVTADSGYCSEKNLLYLKENNIASYIKLQDHEQRKTRAYKEEIGKYYNMKYEVFEDEHYYVCHDGRQLRHIRTETKEQAGYQQTFEVYGCADCSGCQHKSKCLYKYNEEKDTEKNKVMKINEQWEDLKEESHANIQSEKGILKRQTRSIQTEGHFGDIKENENFRRFNYRTSEKVYKEFMLYAIGRNINKYHRFLHNKIQKFEGKSEQKTA